MKCPKGCGWEGEPSEYFEHLERCPSKTGKRAKEKGHSNDRANEATLCNFLMDRIKKLKGEVQREPEYAKKSMMELEERLRRMEREKRIHIIFDERGVLIDKSELNKRKRHVLDVAYENVRLFIHRMGEVLEIAEHFNCPNLDAMQRIYDIEAFVVLTVVLPGISATLV